MNRESGCPVCGGDDVLCGASVDGVTYCFGDPANAGSDWYFHCNGRDGVGRGYIPREAPPDTPLPTSSDFVVDEPSPGRFTPAGFKPAPRAPARFKRGPQANSGVARRGGRRGNSDDMPGRRGGERDDAGDAGAHPFGPVLVNLADVRPEPVRWLWPERMALGKLTLLVGDPGLGKSFITLDLAARVSRGMAWPDAPKAANAAGGVVLLNAEDGLGDTVRVRLDAAGADVSRVNAIEAVRTRDPDTGGTRRTGFNLAADLAALEAAILQTPDCRLVIIDPVSAYMPSGRGFDSHRNTDVRGVLGPLGELAGRLGVAVVAVTHLRKAEGLVMYRAMGSLAFIAAARAAWAVAKDKGDPTGARRLLLPVKNNLGNDSTGLAYELRPTESGIPCVAWNADPVNVSADDALSGGGERGDGGSDREHAADFLREALAGGEQPADEILLQARQNGFNDKLIRAAFKSIGGTRRRAGFGPMGRWYWRLPDGDAGPDRAPDDGGRASDARIVAIDSQARKPGNNGNNATTRRADGPGGDEFPPDVIRFNGLDAAGDGAGEPDG